MVTSLLRSNQPVTLEGEFFHLRDAILLPRPQRVNGPPILIGGSGPKLTLPLAAKYANEWNGTFLTPQRFAEVNQRLNRLLAANGRTQTEVRRSLMTGLVFGRDDAEIGRKVSARGQSAEQLGGRGILIGTAPAVVEQQKKLEEVGRQRVMLQWLDLDDLDGLEALAKGVLPYFKG